MNTMFIRTLTSLALAVVATAGARTIVWADLSPAIQARLQQSGITASSFDSKVAAIAREAQTRVREGDFDHLVFYVLQSSHFAKLPPIEPALSAKAFVEGKKIPSDAERRISAFVAAVGSADRDPRIVYFRALLKEPSAQERRATVVAEYSRAMRFLYEKEFRDRSPGAVARLYQTRGLSTDTAVEAGYGVQVGLGIIKALEPSRKIRRVLIVGPGIDLAPRTALLEVGPPESYQPWAVIDALVGLDLASVDDLQVVGADINPRVVDRLRAARQAPPVLRLVSGLGESETVAFVADYREYFNAFGGSLGTAAAGGKPPAGHLAKTVTVSAKVAAVLRAEPLNIVTERLTDAGFDLVIATNILPYFDRMELLLALSNISAMLTPGGLFLHNETRPGLAEDTAAAGLPLEQSRQVMIATVKGAPPLADTISLHRRGSQEIKR